MMHTMLKLALLIFLYLVSGTSSSRHAPHNVVRNMERSLLQLMVDTRPQQRANPQGSMACFDYYIPLIDGLGEEYKENYAACTATAEAYYRQIDANTQPQRDLIESSAQSSCDALGGCAKLSGSIEYFGCFADAGSANTEIMYKISGNASDTLLTVREEYRMVEIEEYRCTNASERAYVEKAYQTNLDLQSCLRGEIAPPTAGTPTTSPPTSTPPTSTPPTTTPPLTTLVTTTTPPATTPETTPTPSESSSAAPETTTDSVELSTETPETTPAPTSVIYETSIITVEPTTEAAETSTSAPTVSSSTPSARSESESESSNQSSPEISLRSNSESSEEDFFLLRTHDLVKLRDALQKPLKTLKTNKMLKTHKRE